MMETEIIDKLYLELSQFTKAKTSKELSLEREILKLRKIAAHVPAMVYIKAKEDAGYPDYVVAKA